jgi:DNA-binding response OmpR family regulator
VLVVDDDASLRLLCRVNLELEGHRVLEATSLAAAREQLEREDVDVVLLDLHLGQDNGALVLDELIEPDGPRVFLFTGKDVPEPVRARADGVIPKPFTLEQLSAAVGGATRV